MQINNPEKLTSTIKNLQKQVNHMKVSLGAEQRNNMVEADYTFHNIIVKSTGNNLFYSIYNTLRSFLLEDIIQSQSDYIDPEMIICEHQAIIDTIKSRDASQSIDVFSSHIKNIKSRLKIN